MEFAGKITNISPIEEKGENKIRTITVEEQSWDYPQSGTFTFMNKTIPQTEKVSEWDDVEISFNIKSKEYQWKRYNWLNWYKIISNSKAKIEDSVF